MVNETVLAQMDEAARKARQEFMDEVVAKAGTAKNVANWMKTNYAQCGYKRLSKIVLELADK
jgi:hypothetical protein